MQGIENDLEEIKQIIISRESIQGISKELEELRQLNEEIKKSNKFRYLEIPGLILLILLLYFLILPILTGQPPV